MSGRFLSSNSELFQNWLNTQQLEFQEPGVLQIEVLGFSCLDVLK